MNTLLTLLIKLTRFGRRARVLLYRRLAAFTRDGVPVADALKLLQQRYTATEDNRRHMLSDWLQKMRAGQPFTQALGNWVPAQELVMLSHRTNGPAGRRRFTCSLSISPAIGTSR